MSTMAARCLLAPLLLLAGCGPSAREVAEARQRAEQAQLDEQRARYKAAVENVLSLDGRTSAIHDTARRAAAMRTIDTATCPPEFRAAYLDHTYAWAYMAKVRQARAELASDGSIQDVLVRSIIASANDSAERPIEDLFRSDEDLKRLEGAASDRIDETFRAVEKVAIQYGAALPAGQ